MNKQEQEYLEYKRLGQKLGIPTFEVFLELEVRMPDGRVVHRHRQRSHSWTRNAYNLMFCQLAGKDADDATFEAGKLSVKKTSATIAYGSGAVGWKPFASADSAQAGTGWTHTGYRALAGYDTHGIIVGTGTTAESFEDYALATQIADGTGSGELSHVESEAHAISYAALVLTNTLIRYFNNNSGGSIGVNEVGLIGALGDPGAVYNSAPILVLVARDVLGATVTVPDTGQLKVTYTISLTYPS